MPDLDQENEMEEQANNEKQNGGTNKLVIELHLKDNADKAGETRSKDSNVTSTGMKLSYRIQPFADTLFNVVKICAFIIFLISMSLIFIKISSFQEGTIILPFEVSGDEALSGTAIADQLTSELIQIQQIHGEKYDDLLFRANGSYFSSSLPTEQDLGSREMVISKADTIEFGMGDIGSIDTGAGSLSLGNLIIALNNIIPGKKSIETIRGSLQTYESNIVLVALLEGNRVQSWMIKRPLNNERDQIPEVVKDLAFMIAFDRQKSNVSAKTWEGLKCHTEALDAYHQYQLSGDLNFLDLAAVNSLKAIKNEKRYKNIYELMSSIELTYLRIGRETDAIELCNKAIELDPTYSLGWINKGINLIFQQKYDEAVEAYEEAIRLDPGDSSAWSHKGNALSHQRKYDEAVEAYEEAIRLEPDYAFAWNNKGNALCKEGKYNDSIKAFEEAIRLDPDYACAWNNKGIALRIQGKYNESIEAYEEAIRLDPIYTEVWNNKGFVLYKQGKYEEAIETYDEAIRLDPGYAVAWNNKGNALSKLDKSRSQIAFNRSREVGSNGIFPGLN
ncbi:MAG: tetratricopeptide repeat protein [Methanothrix sp.]